ncbi:MAG TPA: prohibitin family protein [Blastocatellia bacterium]|nr:prohibitin family protein [Blastocatellia bacterium]
MRNQPDDLERDPFLERGRRRNFTPATFWLKFLGAAFLLLIVIILGAKSVTTVESGTHAVLRRWGKAEQVLEPGLHFYNPISTSLQIYETRIRTHTENVSVTSVDNVRFTADVTVAYAPDPKRLVELDSRLGREYLARLTPIIQTASRDVFSDIKIYDVVAQVGRVTQELKASLDPQFAAHNVLLESVQISNVDLPDNVEIQAAEVAAAAKAKEAAEFRLQAAKIEQETRALEARTAAQNPELIRLRQLEIMREIELSRNDAIKNTKVQTLIIGTLPAGVQAMVPVKE